jgi:hypothetical protein
MIKAKKQELIEIGYIIGTGIIGGLLILSIYVYNWILIYQEV